MSSSLAFPSQLTDGDPSCSQIVVGSLLQTKNADRPTSLNREAARDQSEVQGGLHVTPNGEGDSSVVHLTTSHHVEATSERICEASTGHRELSAPSNANSPNPSIRHDMAAGPEPDLRIEADSELLHSSVATQQLHATSSSDRKGQPGGAQLHRPRASSHGGLNLNEVQPRLASGGQVLSAPLLAKSNSLDSHNRENQDTEFRRSDSSRSSGDLLPSGMDHVTQTQQQNTEPGSVKSESQLLNEAEPRPMSPTKTGNNNPLAFQSERVPPGDNTRNAQRANDKAAAYLEAKLHATLKRVTNPKKFFVFGKVFHTLWVEPTGETQSNSGSNPTVVSGISTVAFGERIFSNIRRFVVVREGERSCTALRIMTYGGQGVAKKGVQKCEHAIIYTGKDAPDPDARERAKRGEEGLLPRAIRVVADDGMEKLDPMSRLDFGEVYTIQHFARVRGIGMVHRKSFEPFLYQFKSVFEQHGSHGRFGTASSGQLPSIGHEEPRYWAKQHDGPRGQNGHHAYGLSQRTVRSDLRNLHSRGDFFSREASITDMNSDGDGSEGHETIRPSRPSHIPRDIQGPGKVLEYSRRGNGWFKRYRVIKVLWHDNPDDSDSSEYSNGVTYTAEAPRQRKMRSEVKSFVVLGATTYHSLCIPITSPQPPVPPLYGVNPDHRAILYTLDDPDHAWPQKVPDAMRSPIKVQCNPSRNDFEAFSRLEYSRVHTVEHSYRVKAFGWIHRASHEAFDRDQDYVYRLITYRNPATFSDSDDSDNSDETEYHSLVNEDG